MRNFQFSIFNFQEIEGGFTPYINFGCPDALSGRKRSCRSCITGFTLIEVVVAFGIILAALVGPVSLIMRGLIDITFAKNKLIALNLAQEGIELVRLARENNVLCDVLDGGAVESIPWDENPGGSPNKLYDNPQPRRADSLNLLEIGCGPDMQSPRFQQAAGNAQLRFYTGGSFLGFYGHPGAGGSSINTPFSREITIETMGVGGDPDDAMRVTSTVTWTERGLNRSVELRDVLYNWR